MKFYSFQIVIEKEQEDEGYCACTTNVPGCFGNGKTIEEAKRNIRQAAERHLASLVAHGEPTLERASGDRSTHVPKDDRLLGQVDAFNFPTRALPCTTLAVPCIGRGLVGPPFAVFPSRRR